MRRPHGSGLGQVRWVAERSFAWLHQFKRPRTRYEYRTDLHRGLVQPACCMICLRRLCKAHHHSASLIEGATLQ
ncbi:transposase [Streptomyces sparsogenes]|uniref:transposase n=1 Tax=Streptomyces sparsogenes TaxID=67365 RepID=UPI0033E923B7